MTTPNSQIGHGSIFGVSNADSPETFAAVETVTSIEFGGSATDTLDDSAIGDSSLARQYITGRRKAGDVTVKCWYKPGATNQGKVITLWKSGAVSNFKVTYPNGTSTESFAGIVVSFDRTVDDNKQIEATFKVTISGEITLA